MSAPDVYKRQGDIIVIKPGEKIPLDGKVVFGESMVDTSAPVSYTHLGFERIVTILLDNGFTVPGAGQKKAFLFEKGIDSASLAAVIREAMEERKNGVQVLVAQMNKNKKFQKEQLGKEGYQEFKEFYKESLKH